jgi:serine/threonine protein kinase
MRANGIFSGKQLYGICKQILTGLCFIHSQRWAHLDLKPGNIFIDKHGRAKLADFGISRMFEHDNGAKLRGGTPQFTAPELLQRGSYDPFKADIWSFAVTCYCIAFGSYPYPQPVLGEPFPAFTFADIPFPSDTDPAFMAALRAMFVVDADARPSAAECLELPLFASADVKDGWLGERGNARDDGRAAVRASSLILQGLHRQPANGAQKASRMDSHPMIAPRAAFMHKQFPMHVKCDRCVDVPR